MVLVLFDRHVRSYSIAGGLNEKAGRKRCAFSHLRWDFLSILCLEQEVESFLRGIEELAARKVSPAACAPFAFFVPPPPVFALKSEEEF